MGYAFINIADPHQIVQFHKGSRRNKALVERDLGFVMRTTTAKNMGIASVFRQGETEIKGDDAYKEELLDYEEGNEKAPYVM
nr:hypothetical protein [Tanacetum cinerariifolium]